MNFRKTFSRGLILPVLFASGMPNAPATAAPVTKTYTYNGTVANACTLGNPSVGLNVSRTNAGITITFTPTSVTVSCNTASGGVLSVSSTQLVRQSNSVAQDYQLTVAGWGSSIVYNTAAGTPHVQTQSKTGLGPSTLTFSCSSLCTNTQINNNNTYIATITLGIAANP